MLNHYITCNCLLNHYNIHNISCAHSNKSLCKPHRLTVTNQAVHSVQPIYNHSTDKSRTTSHIRKKQNNPNNCNNTHPVILKDNKLTLCFWNGRAIKEKTQDIKDFRLSNDIDIYLLAETWLSSENHSSTITELKDNTCNFINYPRPFSDRGGGLGVIYKKQLSIVREIPPIILTSMQVLQLTLTVFSKKYTIVVIYRSESSHNHKYKMTTFFKELRELLSHYNTCKNDLIITGDFNIHVNDLDNPRTSKFMDILDTFNLVQHIHEPTHELGNTLDLIITRKTSRMTEFHVDSQLSSDHNNIIFKLDFKKPSPMKKIVTNRKLKSIHKENFKNDIARSLSFNASNNASPEYLDNLIDTFNSASDVLDHHAPLTTRTVTIRDRTPWTSEEIRPEKQKRRKLEKNGKEPAYRLTWTTSKLKKTE